MQIKNFKNNEQTHNEQAHNDQQKEQQTARSQRRVLSAGEWLRATTDFRAPFGHDRLPTVWE